MKENLKRRLDCSMECLNDKANFTTGNKETTKKVETSQKAYLNGLPAGFITLQQMKENLKRRIDCSMNYSDNIHVPIKKAKKALGGHTETTQTVNTSQYSKELPKGFKTRREMEEKLKRRPEKNTSVLYSVNGAPYDSAAEGRVSNVTTPKTRESDKLYCPNDKANFTTGNEGTTKRVETSHKIHVPIKKAKKAQGGHIETTKTVKTSQHAKEIPKGFKTRREMEEKLKRSPEKNASISDSGNDASYILAPYGRVTYQTNPKIRENDKASWSDDKANMATNNRDVIDDSNYNQRGDMASTIINGARLQARRNDTYYRHDKSAENNNKNDGLGGDMNKTKKNDTRQECFVVMTMNTNGQNEKKLEEPQDKRRQVVTMLLETYDPDIMFCQEFQSTDIYGRVWSKYGISTNYVFDGNREGSILVHKKQFDVHSSVDGEHINTVLRRILEGLQRSSVNALNETFPLEFDPLSRMCMYVINPKDGKTRKFLCASWHGWWNKKHREGRIKLFIYLMEFLRQVVEKFKLPLIVGGDFNIDILDVKGIVKDPFSLGMYASSKRRKDKEKDFFIVSKDLRLENIQCIDYEEDALFRANLKEFNPNDILDHDPIKATLKFA